MRDTGCGRRKTEDLKNFVASFVELKQKIGVMRDAGFILGFASDEEWLAGAWCEACKTGPALFRSLRSLCYAAALFALRAKSGGRGGTRTRKPCGTRS